MWAAGPLISGVFYFAFAMLFFVVGFWGATIYKRFGGIVLSVILIALGLLLVGCMWLVGRANAWMQVFTWFADLGTGGLTLLMGGLVVVLAAVAFPALRRTVP